MLTMQVLHLLELLPLHSVYQLLFRLHRQLLAFSFPLLQLSSSLLCQHVLLSLLLLRSCQLVLLFYAELQPVGDQLELPLIPTIG